MSLPKKRKRLSEGKAPVGKKQTRGIRDGSTEQIIPKVSDRTEQMQKAFEIVEHIEHVQDGPDQLKPAAAAAFPDLRTPPSPEAFRLRVSVDPDPVGSRDRRDESEKADTPVIEVKLTIPSFLWKVPVLKDVTQRLIRRLSKEKG
ncbi:MAG TPA: hypothetical protein VN416_03350 [Desulfomonilia bacterium]|nr:hypothetical protein [Desulfomonilia bacterium]